MTEKLHTSRVSSEGVRGADIAVEVADPAAKEGRLEDDPDHVRPKVYQTGWRLHMLTAGICMSLLLSTLETTIVSTSLVSIVNDLHGFGQSGWVVTSYMLTYTGFLIIYAKLSDILGCKLLILISVALFTIFSIACGASISMLPLIIFRAFQGMGASGIYSLSTVMTPLMVPPAKYATYIGIMSSVFAISSVLGPLLGGVISDNTTWRWVFYLNGPGGVIAFSLLFFSIPFSFPYEGDSPQFFKTLVAQQSWRRIDIFGVISLLAASILLVFALQQAGTANAWNSGPIISAFVISGVLWVVWFAWQRRLSLAGGICEPVFPWRLACNRFVLGLLLNGFLTGLPFMAAIINIPQRMQTANGTTAIESGIRLLPLLLCSPLATTVAGLLISKLRTPPLYMFIAGCSFQILGVGLFSSLDPTERDIPARQYGYQVIMGFGFGFNLSTILMMTPMLVKPRDMAVAMGSVTQIRVLGGTIGLAICSTLLNNQITAETSRFLTPSQVGALLQSFQSIEHLPPGVQNEVRNVYGAAYGEQMRVMLYFSVVAMVSLVLLAERRPRRPELTESGEIKVWE
ncbi:Major facilitator superfamily domain containing protein [Rhypophila decipiens]